MYTKFIATIGPASDPREVMESLIVAGMDIARFNFSHALPDEIYSRTEIIRQVSQSHHKEVKILQDLCGRRLRVGEMPNGAAEIIANEPVTFYTMGAPDVQPNELPIMDDTLHQDLKSGQQFLLESGRFRGEVLSVDPDRQRITVVFKNGGKLKSKKGINVPYAELTSPALTDKDKKDLVLGKELNFEYIALSFVQSAADLEELRSLIHPHQKIISKIEDPIGVAKIEEIVDASDAIMVARGDLGVELPLEEIPFIQKEIVSRCRYAGKPSIVATQMLLSMVDNPSPTRAEVSDVANAVLDGADAVMLSDETAVGDYPRDALETLVRITERTEAFLHERENKL